MSTLVSCLGAARIASDSILAAGTFLVDRLPSSRCATETGNCDVADVARRLQTTRPKGKHSHSNPKDGWDFSRSSAERIQHAENDPHLLSGLPNHRGYYGRTGKAPGT